MELLAIIVTAVFGIAAIVQGHYYFNLKKQFDEIKNNVNSVKETCDTIKMQLDDSIEKQIVSRYLALTDKTFKNGKTPNINNFEQIVADALKKNDGNKNIVQLIGKQHTDIESIKITLNTVMTLNSALSYQIIGNTEDIAEEIKVEEYLETKIVNLCKSKPLVMLRDILGSSSANIPCQKKLEIIEKLKNDGTIIYSKTELCENTVISLSVELENPQ